MIHDRAASGGLAAPAKTAMNPNAQTDHRFLQEQAEGMAKDEPWKDSRVHLAAQQAAIRLDFTSRLPTDRIEQQGFVPIL